MADGFKGENFLVTIERGIPTTRINADKVRALLSAEQITEVEVTTLSDKVTTTRLDSTKKDKFVPPDTTNMTPAGAADILGEVREQKNKLLREEEFWKQWLESYFQDQEKKDENAGGINS